MFKRFIRFSIVGLSGQLLYLVLFYIFISSKFGNTNSVIYAGSICTLFNSYFHSLFSLNVSYTFTYLIKYLFIQLVCLFFAKTLSDLLTFYSFSSFLVGLLTLALWGFISFTLSILVLKIIPQMLTIDTSQKTYTNRAKNNRKVERDIK